MLYEQPLGEVTTGFDTKTSRTLITSYNAVATGPDRMEDPAVRVLTEAAQNSLKVAIATYMATPGEVAIRFKAAMSAFEVSLKQQITGNRFAQAYKDSIRLDLVQRVRWEDGLVLRLSINNPVVAEARKLHDSIKKHFPPVVNTLIRLNMDLFEPNFTAKFPIPPTVKDVLAVLPSPQQLDEARRGLERAMVDAGRSLDAAGAKFAKEVNAGLRDTSREAGRFAGKRRTRVQTVLRQS